MNLNHSFTVLTKYLLSLFYVPGDGDAALNKINMVPALKCFSPELKAILSHYKCVEYHELQAQSVTEVYSRQI